MTDPIEITTAEARVQGDSQDRYWLTDRPEIAVTAYPNALNKFCRELVRLGKRGAANIRGADGRLRMTLRSVEEVASVELREHPEKGFYTAPYRPLPERLKAA